MFNHNHPTQNYKRKEIIRYARTYACDNFVETGTFMAGTVLAVKDVFKEIYSIELSEKLHAENIQRVKGIANVHLYCGDSAVMMPKILEFISGPTLFWLDAHWSGGRTAKGISNSPILDEINTILEFPFSTVVLVDDVRLFGEGGWPELVVVVERLKSRFESVEVVEDVLRAVGRL